MKKIDLHIHTIATISDAHFVFDLNAFVEYVTVAKLDAVAVTNHNVFDIDQFRAIKNALPATVFPGIEINLANGHLLLIACDRELDSFQSRCDQVTKKIQDKTDFITFDELVEIYGDLNAYLLIPHADKNPEITGDTLKMLQPYLSAGEVASSKKFIYAIKDAKKPTPVLFSDLRIQAHLKNFMGRQTYIDCSDITIGAMKSCLQDKNKVALSEDDGNSLFQIFEDGQMLSTGLNILLGERSSGKTFTLDRIRDVVENPKYITQFQLVQQDNISEKDFNTDVQNRRSIFISEYLSSFKGVTDEVIHINLHANDAQLNEFLTSLLKSAGEAGRQDAYSKAALFSENEFSTTDSESLSQLIGSIRDIIENIEFRPAIEKHISHRSLKNLACELILALRTRALELRKRRLINEIIKDVKIQLQMHTSATPVEEIDLYKYRIEIEKVKKFETIVNVLKQESTIYEENIQGFRIEAKKTPFTKSGDVKAVSGKRTAFSDAFKKYDHPMIIFENY